MSAQPSWEEAVAVCWGFIVGGLKDRNMKLTHEAL